VAVKPAHDGPYVYSEVRYHVPQIAASLLLWTPSIALPAGGSHKLHATLLDQFGNAMRHQPSITWSLHGTPRGHLDGSTYIAPNTPGSQNMIHASVKDSVAGLIGADVSATVISTHRYTRSVPAAVIHAHAQLDDNFNVMLTWTPVDHSADGFAVEASLDGRAFALLGIVPRGQTSFLATSLDQGPRYAYRIVPFNAAGVGIGANTNTIRLTPDYYGFPSPLYANGFTGGIGGRAGQMDVVTVANPGSVPLEAPISVDIYAESADQQILMGSANYSTAFGSGMTPPTLLPGASATFSIKSILPADMPDGAYQLSAGITTPVGQFIITSEVAYFRVQHWQVHELRS
jgi:hypothetical protein